MSIASTSCSVDIANVIIYKHKYLKWILVSKLWLLQGVCVCESVLLKINTEWNTCRYDNDGIMKF